jgi:hypothetical protein
MRFTWKLASVAGILMLGIGALLIPSAAQGKPGSPEAGFTPVLIPSNVAVKCAPGAQFGTSVGPVHIGIHYVGTGHLYGAKTVTVSGLPGSNHYVLSTPHYTTVIPKGTRMPCSRAFNVGTWTPNTGSHHPAGVSAKKELHFTFCASPHC